MMPPAYAVLVVHATSHAMRIEKLLQAEGVACKLIPVPRHISSDCGVCLRVRYQDLEAALRTVEAAGIGLKGVHSI